MKNLAEHVQDLTGMNIDDVAETLARHRRGYEQRIRVLKREMTAMQQKIESYEAKLRDIEQSEFWLNR